VSTSRITISTHVLDTSLGKPAGGVNVDLTRVEPRDAAELVASGVTNVDGRVPSLVPDGAEIVAGIYRLNFSVTPYFIATQREHLYPWISIYFTVSDEPQHYHIPLLLNPYGFSTYRGS
jgi:5-hydroxyisourate hydrolase